MASAPQLEATLREIIAEVRADTIGELVAGGPEDYAAYRETVGYIRALDQFPEWCAEAGKKLDER